MATPIKASTQVFLEIEDIIDDLAILADGSVALILETGAVNFGLLSRDEQEAIIYAFAAFINSLSFPIQISVLSKRMDISEYLSLIAVAERTQKSSRLKEKLQSYNQFILSLVRDNQVLEKRFFIVIPFTSLELGVKGTSSSLVKQSKKLPYPKNYILERAKTTLYPKRDHVMRQITRLGLRANQLTTKQITNLIYELYNPEAGEGQRIQDNVTNPMVGAQKQ